MICIGSVITKYGRGYEVGFTHPYILPSCLEYFMGQFEELDGVLWDSIFRVHKSVCNPLRTLLLYTQSMVRAHKVHKLAYRIMKTQILNLQLAPQRARVARPSILRLKHTRNLFIP